MKNSIELIWKEGFLNEKNLIAPKINDLYNQKSQHLVDRMKRMFRFSSVLTISMAIAAPVIYYFIDAFWQGVAAAVLLLLTAWYVKRQMRDLQTLDQGVTSLDYLKSFDRWLKDVIVRCEKTVRYSYPLYFLIAVSTMASAWNNQEKLVLMTRERFADSILIGNFPLFAWIITGVLTLLIAYFSDKIYRFDVRLLYGRVMSKLEETIAEMETLKQE